MLFSAPQRFLALALLVVIGTTGGTSAQDRQSSGNSGRWNVNWGRINDRQPTPVISDSEQSLFELGGWTSAGVKLNGHGNRTGNGNTPLPLNNVADTPVFNQLWLYAEKPINAECGEWDCGFRIDCVFGADGPDNQAAGDEGWDFGWDSSRDYGTAIPQLYAEIGTEDFVLLTGYFLGLQGFEGQPVDNFFYSRNYAFGYGVPGTHSGVLATWYVSDQFEIDAGWTTGWDSSWANYLNASTFVGGLTWNPNEDVSLTYHLCAGDFGDGTAKKGNESNAGDLYSHAIVFTYGLNSRAAYVLENTLGTNTGIGRKNNQWYSVTNYFFYELSDQLDIGARIEWFRDDDGQRVDVNGAGAGSYYEATIGVNWKPYANLSIRPELRWDWFSGQGRPFDSRNGGMSGTSSSQFTAGFDCVITF